MNDLTRRRRLSILERKHVYEKCKGHCAYCGEKLDMKDMQIDHIVPLCRGGKDELENMLPACRSCNHYKRTSSIEGFREMIEKIPDKLERDSYIYRIGRRYGNVTSNKKAIGFYFEKMKEGQNE